MTQDELELHRVLYALQVTDHHLLLAVPGSREEARLEARRRGLMDRLASSDRRHAAMARPGPVHGRARAA